MIRIEMNRQPDDETCGPTSLHAIYKYYGDTITLSEVVKQVSRVPTGGTLAPLLGKHALERGYNAYIYVYNLDLFDPTWFHPRKMSNKLLLKKLETQMQHKISPRHMESALAHHAFIEMGGEIRFHDLTVGLLKQYFKTQTPLLTGLSATYLYQNIREYGDGKGGVIQDDIKGEPLGHFVILCGYDDAKRRIVIADPHRENPLSHDNYYKVNVSRLINSIMLGVLTYDANLLVIQPKNI